MITTILTLQVSDFKMVSQMNSTITYWRYCQYHLAFVLEMFTVEEGGRHLHKANQTVISDLQRFKMGKCDKEEAVINSWWWTGLKK